jgi:hypothetical protein
MWRLVCSRDVKVEYRDIRTEGPEVKGHWVFDYKFHDVNPVHNEMDSTFVLRDGKILSHRDRGSRWNWARQALGIPKGALVTLLPFILRGQAKKELEESKKIHLPDALHDRLWLMARQRKTTVSAVAADILDKNLPRFRVEREG